MTLFNNHDLLPAPSILEKLDLEIPGSSKAIMANVEIIGQQRRDQEMKLHSRAKSMLQGIKEAFNINLILYPGPYNTGYTSPEAVQMYKDAQQASIEEKINLNWARVGDTMRLAIEKFLCDNNLNAETLGLTAEERKSLVLLMEDSRPRPEPETKTWLHKVFPKL